MSCKYGCDECTGMRGNVDGFEDDVIGGCLRTLEREKDMWIKSEKRVGEIQRKVVNKHYKYEDVKDGDGVNGFFDVFFHKIGKHLESSEEICCDSMMNEVEMKCKNGDMILIRFCKKCCGMNTGKVLSSGYCKCLCVNVMSGNVRKGVYKNEVVRINRLNDDRVQDSVLCCDECSGDDRYFGNEIKYNVVSAKYYVDSYPRDVYERWKDVIKNNPGWLKEENKERRVGMLSNCYNLLHKINVYDDEKSSYEVNFVHNFVHKLEKHVKKSNKMCCNECCEDVEFKLNDGMIEKISFCRKCSNIL